MSRVAMIVKLTAAPGKREELAQKLASMFEQVDTEPGTEVYALHEDYSNPDVLWMYELYRDQEALQRHSTSPAMAELLANLGGGLVGAPPEMSMVNPIRAKGFPVQET